MKPIKKILTAIIAIFIATTLNAQKPDFIVSLDISPEFKSLYTAKGIEQSFGCTSSVAMSFRRFMLGAGFDTGIKSWDMDKYNFYIYGQLGYAILVPHWSFTPSIKAGLFMDFRGDSWNDIYYKNSFLLSPGLESTYGITDQILLRAAIQGLITDSWEYGFSSSLGIKFLFL